MERFISATDGFKIETRDRPLTNEELQNALPALFEGGNWDGLSNKYGHISTPRMIDVMRNEGFQPFFASQAKSRTPAYQPFARHMLRFRHEDSFDASGTQFEMIMINAHDGTSSYRLIPGLFRFVCANGLMTGTTFKDLKVRHMGDEVMNEVIEGSYEVLREAPKMAEVVERWQGVSLDEDRRLEFAQAAHELRFPEAKMEETLRQAPIDAVDLLQTRRNDDRNNDLWSVFNVVQENIIRGGQEGYLMKTVDGNLVDRQATTRAQNSIQSMEYYNRKLWDLGERFAIAA